MATTQYGEASLIMKVRANPSTKSGEQEVNSLMAVAGTEEHDINKQWSKWTPSAQLNFVVNNPGAMNRLEAGREYYLMLVPVPEGDPAGRDAVEHAKSGQIPEPRATAAGMDQPAQVRQERATAAPTQAEQAVKAEEAKKAETAETTSTARDGVIAADDAPARQKKAE